MYTKKAKIEENSPKLIRRIKPKDNANLRNSTGSKNKPITKTGTRDRIPSSNSSVSRSTKKAAVDHEARAKILESRVFELEAKLEIMTKKLSRADELVTIIFPKVIEKKEQQCKNIEEAALEKGGVIDEPSCVRKSNKCRADFKASKRPRKICCSTQCPNFRAINESIRIFRSAKKIETSSKRAQI
ncbi:unnamed protein product [Oikopleura dioica]|uniref:Uncharacterized protein n=1 Tax=Oikopleura dioica TaxID=34765 RepID=E4Y1X7_OIKDI|nr:unnamed protein product [Oikopleura dioica]